MGLPLESAQIMNYTYTLGGITKSLTFCLACFCMGKCSIDFLQNLYFSRLIPYIVSTFPNILNQNKPKKRSRILLSRPLYILYNQMDRGYVTVIASYELLSSLNWSSQHTGSRPKPQAFVLYVCKYCCMRLKASSHIHICRHFVRQT